MFYGEFKGKRVFDAKGIHMVVDFFVKRGHRDVLALVPQHRLRSGWAENQHLLHSLKQKGHLQYTPSNPRLGFTPYDDRYVLYLSI